RRNVGTVVRKRRLWANRVGRGGVRGDEGAALLQYVLSDDAPLRGRTRGEDRESLARRLEARALCQFGVGGERHGAGADPLLLEPAGEAQEEDSHIARACLSRGDDGGGVAVGHHADAPAVGLAAARVREGADRLLVRVWRGQRPECVWA